MRDARRVIRVATALVAGVALVGALAACAHVNREEMQTEMDQLRQEVEAGDQELGERIDDNANRIDGLEGRVDDNAARIDDNAARLDALERDLRDLEEEFNVTVERMEGMIAFNMPVHFEYDSATLREEDRKVLDRFAQVYTSYYSGQLLTVEGFTDEAGSDEYNQRLGQRRAEGVKSYLTEVASLDPERIRAVSYGESQERLVSPGEYGPDEGMENRRVTLVVETS